MRGGNEAIMKEGTCPGINRKALSLSTDSRNLLLSQIILRGHVSLVGWK